MRIVNQQEFIRLPLGTVYARQFEGAFGEFEIKLETVDDHSWRYMDVSPANINLDDTGNFYETLKNVAKPETETGMGFNNIYVENPNNVDFYGMTNDKYTYAVFSKWDIRNMVMLFQKFA